MCVRSSTCLLYTSFISARDDLPAKQKGFKLGIDDYMVKPIEFAELEMRIRALLRRANIEMERRLTVGNLELDADGMTATVDGEDVYKRQPPAAAPSAEAPRCSESQTAAS